MRSHRFVLLLLLLPGTLLVLALHADEMPIKTVLTTGDAQRGKLAQRKNAVVQVVERVRGAVVNIHSERTVNGPLTADMFNMPPTQNRVNGMGTGIIIDQRGYIVTNQHVVEDVNLLRIRLADGTTTNASVVSRSTDVDLALLKVDVNRPLPVMPLGTSADILVGETVIAIGNAYGYEHTVSQGIVSAIKRDVSLNKEIAYKALTQTDAAINPGNSGGPLVNILGELIGVNVAIRAGAQNIGFAIPVDTMVGVVSQMLRARRLLLANDGMIVRDHIQATSDGAVRQVLVERVDTGSGAAVAGLKTGDQMLKVGDIAVACSFDVDRGFLDRQAGESVPVVYLRNGQELRANVVMRSAVGRPDAPGLVLRKLGIQLSPVSVDRVATINRQLNGGMEVTVVQADGAAAKSGMKSGDILVGLHNWETMKLDDVAFVLSHPELSTFNPLQFYIVRSGQIRRGMLQHID